MIPVHFPNVVYAELLKLYTRSAGLMTLAVSGLVGMVVAAVAAWLEYGIRTGMVQGPGVQGDTTQFSAILVGDWALYGRNFFVLPLMLLLVTATVVAGEYTDRTLREVAVRPLSRLSILLAKLLALLSLSALSLFFTFGIAFGAGLAAFGLPASWELLPALLAGYAASLLSDLAIICLGMLASMLMGGVGGVLISAAFLLGADLALRGFLTALNFFGVSGASGLLPWTLGHALDVWLGWKDGWEPQRFIVVVGVAIGAFSLAQLRFSRMDVP